MVTFIALGEVVDEIEVEYGYFLTEEDYPSVPEHEGYVGEWEEYTQPITEDVEIYAEYTPIGIIGPIMPPISGMSLEDQSEIPVNWVLVSTTVETYDYVYNGGKLVQETISTRENDDDTGLRRCTMPMMQVERP